MRMQVHWLWYQQLTLVTKCYVIQKIMQTSDGCTNNSQAHERTGQKSQWWHLTLLCVGRVTAHQSLWQYISSFLSDTQQQFCIIDYNRYTKERNIYSFILTQSFHVVVEVDSSKNCHPCWSALHWFQCTCSGTIWSRHHTAPYHCQPCPLLSQLGRNKDRSYTAGFLW